ncbi:CidA/LrgA family protein [Trinickia dinghuensis]|uniref:CidA/LrgA family protein n=1 Tax=Trinickia dinghuensis TaxID=2291023 RepID=A0A3D8K741_9BURK|nr:CidA/LrgA family protein [Trinickia dinghuensis]RDV00717.1 CidA/LrgA family protein [Trinickia dinghuensis]
MFGFAFYIALDLIGDYLSARFALPVPGSIIALGLVFAMLTARGKVDEPLKASSDMLLRYLAVMLVPTCVGVITLIQHAPSGMATLIVVLVLALVIGSLATGWMANALLARYRAANAPAAS